MKCRCGFEGNGQHPCHGQGYECRQPATQRFYAPRYASLAGVQMKVVVNETWACDNCWAEYSALYLKENNG